jgi:CspA family cold shock protein
MLRTSGTVKWFNNTKEYGFYFAAGRRGMYSCTTAPFKRGIRTLRREQVEFEVKMGPRGPAENVIKLESDSKRNRPQPVSNGAQKQPQAPHCLLRTDYCGKMSQWHTPRSKMGSVSSRGGSVIVAPGDR